jgi:hypothetical protein
MKTRPNKKQKFEIHKAQYATRAFREMLTETRKDLHPVLIGKMQSSEEDKARSNPYGSRFYKKIYTTGPMTRAEIRDAFKENSK